MAHHRSVEDDFPFGNRLFFAFDVETAGTLFLIKVLPMNPAHELILTNRYFWCVNDDPKNWKRSSKPHLVPGVKAFLDDTPATSKRVVRIALIVPACHNVTRYLNESDVETVKPEKPAEGVYFVPFDRLTDLLASRERK